MSKGIFQLFVFVTAITLASCSDKHCVPIQCITKVGCHGDSCMGSVTQFYFYDDLGRLVKDSINAPDTIMATPHRTLYYHYQGDSIISTGEHDSLVFKTNKDGVAIFAGILIRKRYVEYWHPFYNTDGAINRIESGSVSYLGDTMRADIDSIIYLDGNIIAYRSAGAFGLNAAVHCTYYPDRRYRCVFNPTDKILSLSNPGGPVLGTFNVQAYSKNLVKSIEFHGVTKIYTYQFDNEGKVIGMSMAYKSSRFEYTNNSSFKYSCK